MHPVAAGLVFAMVITTGIYGRHLEMELVALKKWDQDRMESLQREILDLRMNVGEAKGNRSTVKAEAANDQKRGG